MVRAANVSEKVVPEGTYGNEGGSTCTHAGYVTSYRARNVFHIAGIAINNIDTGADSYLNFTS